MLTLLRLKALLRGVILPPSGLLLIAIVGLFLINRRPRLARICLIVGIGSLWLLSTPLIAVALEKLAEGYPALDRSIPSGAQAIVILGGGGQRAFAPEYGGAAAGAILLERLSYGAYLAHKTGLPILVTGFRIEAGAMRDTLQRNFGVTPRWVDATSFDTFENASHSVALLEADGIRRIILVTHGTHMRRSVHEFTGAGIEVVPAPVGLDEGDPQGWWLVPTPNALMRSNNAIYEVLGEQVRALLAALHLRRH